MGRPGFRVARRKSRKAKVGITHKIQKEETIKWFQKKYDGEILNK